jgi:AraC-like DNA-binding protein
MEFDPQAFQGTAEYYSIGRPPYSAQLARTVSQELSLDGSGLLLDVGCGPGVLELVLAVLFVRVGEVARKVGYESASAFVAALKRETGITPARYFRETG